MKRVYCLYRVSTLGQVDKEDIPMQREACHEFAKAKGWHIAEEFSEKGVLGFKVSSDKREALQTIKKAAIQKMFDVLLVFMFDRLGRRDDETPFVVEWFVKNGIEVWSVVEGEQRFEDHVDKLLNYIRYWQSSGESLKTSIRTKTRMEQLVKEGVFIGGYAPYGYRLCKLGRVNKRGYEVCDILIDPDEAAVVRRIFQLYCSGEMGVYRIAAHLTSQGILNRSGIPWHHSTIASILRNIVYTGVRKFGDVQSECIPHLRIIEETTYVLAKQQAKMNQISILRGPHSKNRSRVLFGDKMYCMHCGKRMTVTCNRKTNTNKAGKQIVYERLNYICINKSSAPVCDGQRSYSSRKTDGILVDFMNSTLCLDNLKLESIRGVNNVSASQQVSELEHALASEEQTLTDLKNEVVEVIRGTSAFGSVLLADLIQQSEDRIIGLKNDIVLVSDREKKEKQQLQRLYEICHRLNSDTRMAFSDLDFSDKQEIINQLISRVYIGKDDKYLIEWSFGGTVQLQANEWYPKKGENPHNFAQKQDEISNLA